VVEIGAGFTEIKAYGRRPAKINCGYCILVVAQLKHIKQLVEYITGMDTRIGYQTFSRRF
jgi:cell division protein FtsA